MAWGIGGRVCVCVCVCVCKNMNYQGGRGKKIHSYLLNVLAQDFYYWPEAVLDLCDKGRFKETHYTQGT